MIRCLMVAALMLSEVALAGGQSARMPKMELQMNAFSHDQQFYTFPSGLQVVIRHDSDVRSSTVTTVVDAGSSRDPDDKAGVAHMTEHLWFESKREGTGLHDLLYEIGASYDAATTFDSETFTTSGPTEFLAEMIALESQRLTNPLEGVTPLDFARVQSQVEGENQYAADWKAAQTALYRVAFPPGHPYHPGSSNRLGLSDAQAFAKLHYRAENTTITVVSDQDPDTVRNLLFSNLSPQQFHPFMTADDFHIYLRPGGDSDRVDPSDLTQIIIWPTHPGSGPRGEYLDVGEGRELKVRGPTERILPPQPQGRNLAAVDAAVTHPQVVVAWSLPGGYRDEDGLFDVMANSLQAILDSHLVDDRSEVLMIDGVPAVRCGVESHFQASLLVCAAKIDNAANADAASKFILQGVEQLWQADVSSATISERGRSAALFQVLRAFEDPAVHSVTVARTFHYDGYPSPFSRRMQDIMQADRQAVAELAFEYLNPDRAMVGLIQPASMVTPPASPKAGYHGLLFGSRVEGAGTNDRQVAGGEWPGIKEKTLDNGLRVIVIPQGDGPTLRISLVQRGGRISTAPGLDDLADALQYNRVSDPSHTRGIGFFERERLNDNTADHAVGSGGNLDGLLWSLRANADGHEVVASRRSSWGKNAAAGLVEQLQRPDHWARRMRLERLAPTAMGMQTTDFQALKSQSNSDVQAYLSSKYQPATSTLIMIGTVDAGDAILAAEKYFGGWKSSGKPIPDTAPAAPPTKGTVVAHFDAQQPRTTVDFLCRVAGSDVAELELMGGIFRAETFALVESLDGASATRADATQHSGGLTLLDAQVSIPHAKAGELIAGLRLLIDEMTNGYDSDKLSLHQRHLERSHLVGFESSEWVVDNLIAHIDSMGDFIGLGAKVAGINQSSLKNAMGSCASNLVITATGPSAQLQGPLRAAGPVEEVDWIDQRNQAMKSFDPKAYKRMLSAESGR